MDDPITSSVSSGSALTLDALTEMARRWTSASKPRCVTIFTWSLAPQGSVLKFSAPADPKALRWLGPFARDIVDVLADARDGDYAFVLHPAALEQICGPLRLTAPLVLSLPLGCYSGFMGIAVRELTRDADWELPPLHDWGSVLHL